MVIATLRDSTVTPIDTCAWSLRNNYKAAKQGTYYSYIVSQLKAYEIKAQRVNSSNIYGIKNANTNFSHEQALAAVKEGKWVICCMGKGNWTSSGHYILWFDFDGSNVYIRDPNSTAPGRIKAPLSLLQSQVKYYWTVDVSGTAGKTDETGKGDDEVVEKLKVDILGKEYVCDGIFKNGANFISPKVFTDAGFTVSANGSTPVISVPAVKLRIDGKEKSIPGFNSAGTTYAGIRAIAESLGKNVSWDGATGTIVIS